MSHKRLVTALRRLRTGYAIGLALVVAVVPASFAQDPPAPDHGKSAGTATQAKKRQTDDQMSAGLRLETREHSGVSVVAPIGKVSVDPESVEGEATYVRRTTVSQGLTIVEVSNTPFMPVLASNEAIAGGGLRPDQSAGW